MIFRMTKNVFEFNLNLINTFKFHEPLCANISVNETHLIKSFLIPPTENCTSILGLKTLRIIYFRPFYNEVN
jgi:hypothetical protein